MQANPETMSLLSSLQSLQADVNAVTDFILHVVYSRPKKEKTPGDSRYAMLFTGKGTKRITPSKRLPPDHKSLTCHIQRVNLVVHGMINCLNVTYDQLDPLQYGWKLENGIPMPIWYEGTALPTVEELAQITTIQNTDEPSTTVSLENIRPEDPNDFVENQDSDSDEDDDALLSDHSTD